MNDYRNSPENWKKGFVPVTRGPAEYRVIYDDTRGEFWLSSYTDPAVRYRRLNHEEVKRLYQMRLETPQ